MFEHREGTEAARLDAFVDGAFAFTLTLLLTRAVAALELSSHRS